MNYIPPLYIDLTSNQPDTEAEREKNGRRLERERLEHCLEDILDRQHELPSMMLSEPDDISTLLIVQTRKLYKYGYYYACCAMCGISVERILKERYNTQNKKTFGQLINFIKEFERMSKDNIEILEMIKNNIRNPYCHGNDEAVNSKENALNAIKSLHCIIEETKSIFTTHEIKNGFFIKKTKQ